ncbi:hypothetical protein LMH87_010035 [Akanthomyces muscarius]|uniref:EthD domain-containing protein n=1 Tax=Akanthomyces muscarius TaxID=2231603 RepID=A0A9W8UMT9_AKAMU|nr:hypothetical protein LMH87_010035 [Akanthomyces muscarius]KAJ4153551.1 hypothetical protein LMH87_010035 [Akanthomyces muscarius]
MKLAGLVTALFAAGGLATQSCPSNPPVTGPNTSAPVVPAVCKTVNPVCTSYQEKLYHMKMYYNRKNGTTPEEFNRYWAYEHGKLTQQFHIRIGVIKYMQYHSTPEFRDQGKVDGAPPILEYDGSSEYWARDTQTFMNMLSDKEYQTKIAPDEANFLDPQSVRLIIGVDYVVVENQNAVTEHGRTF